MYKPELRIREFEIYKSVYCRLCKNLGDKFGIKSRFLLNYDFTFLAMLLISQEKDMIQIESSKCVFNPCKKCNFLKNYNNIFDFVSAVTVITAYYKIKDDISDSKFFGKLKSYFLLLLFLRSYKKAAKLYSKIDKIIFNEMNKQHDIEKNFISSIDIAAEPTAFMLSNILKEYNNSLHKLGYFLGRWIYLIDAADDLEEDTKKNNFNPFKNNFKKEEINEILNQNVSIIIQEYNLLNKKSFKPILDNILILGLSDIQRKILFFRKEEKNERSI